MRLEGFGLGIAKGLALTFRHLFRRPITVQYPEQRLAVSRRSRGNRLIWKPDLCTGCASCAKACPQGTIKIVTSAGDNAYVVEKFEVDIGHCMFCGLCVEVCPFEALYLSRSYEQAEYRRDELVMGKEKLMLEEQPSAYARPRLEAEIPEQTLLLHRK